MTKVRHIGLDVHKDSIVIAVAEEGRDEALRDLERARDDAKRAERTARQQLLKFLLRHDRRYDGKTNWTLAHFAWIRRQKFEHTAQQYVLADYLKTVEDATERVKHLETQIEEVVHESALEPLIKAFQAFRGIALVSAVTIAAETGDFKRFNTASQFMSYVGLTPSEHSSGLKRRQGAITRAGNGHLRRILVEAAWHYLRRPAMSRENSSPWSSKRWGRGDVELAPGRSDLHQHRTDRHAKRLRRALGDHRASMG